MGGKLALERILVDGFAYTAICMSSLQLFSLLKSITSYQNARKTIFLALSRLSSMQRLKIIIFVMDQ